MSKKGENIRKRKDGRWEGRYKKGRKENGQIIYHSVYGKTYTEVKNKIATVFQEEHSQQFNPAEKRFKDVLNLWEAANRIRLKGGTENRYSFLIETHIKPKLGDLKLSQITATAINSFLLEKLQNGRIDGKGGLSAAYVRSIIIIINSALKFAVDEQMCQPLRTPIYKPPVTKKEIIILTPDEQKKLEEYILQNPTPSNIGVMITLYTGLRIGEMCALSWKDIDFTNKIIHVRHTVARVKSNEYTDKPKTKLIIDSPKTKTSNREIPLLEPLILLLSQIKKTSKSEYVISQQDTFVSPRTFEARFHKLLKSCEIKSVNYHALRHTFATRCIESGVDVKSLSEILGHANVSITLNTYVHSSMKMKKIQLEKLISLTA